MKKLWALLMACVGLGLLALPVWAQDTPLTLRLRRDFGYGFGAELQGALSLSVEGEESLTRVTYWIDEEQVAEITAGPSFRWAFNTDQFAPGQHALKAIAYTTGERVLVSNVIRVNFLSLEEANSKTFGIIAPILGLIFGAILLSTLGTFVLGRRTPPPEPGTPRTYGMAGGAICPQCKRPFARHMLAPNLLLGKLERCPYCGKVSIVPAASREALAAAEAAETAAAAPASASNAEDQLRRDLESSRYQDE